MTEQRATNRVRNQRAAILALAALMALAALPGCAPKSTPATQPPPEPVAPSMPSSTEIEDRVAILKQQSSTLTGLSAVLPRPTSEEDRERLRQIFAIYSEALPN